MRVQEILKEGTPDRLEWCYAEIASHARQIIEMTEKAMVQYAKPGAAALDQRQADAYIHELRRLIDVSVEAAGLIDRKSGAEELERMVDTYQRKNQDYGDSFGGTMERFGLVAGAVRIHDKVSRMLTLKGREGLVADESLGDTLRDLGTYAAMVTGWIKSEREE